MLPLPAGTRRRRTHAPREGLTFQEDSWAAKLGRIRRRIFTASSPSNSIQNNSVASSDTGRAGPNPSEQRALVDEYAKEDEMGDWETSKIVVGQDIDFLHSDSSPDSDGLNIGHVSSERDSSQRTTTRTGPVDASEFADDFLHWRWGGNLFITIRDYLANFFDPRFPEEEAERQFQKERWYNNKPLALCATLFMLLNWVLYLVFNRSITLYQHIAYYGVATFFTLPLPVFVALDFPRRPGFDTFFQFWLMFATWVFACCEVIETHVCHFFIPDLKYQCGYKDFLFMMTYSIAMPALVLFSCHQKRGYASFGMLVQFAFICGLVLPVQEIFVRNVVSFFLFSTFFIIVHYVNERIDRRNFILRAQLKISFKAQQKAQIAQKQAANSKRRFISYIFHEVRVPLNSAMLAFQNLQSNRSFALFCASNSSSLSVEIAALEGSMSAMKQVLDDVLDLQRMDSGRFESNPHAFEFHQCLRSMLGTLRVATDAKGLGLEVELDERIDEVVSNIKGGEGEGAGAGGSGGGSGEEQKERGQGVGGTWVVGDSLRLRQVLSNFFSNAVKFTPEGGGSISVKTTLVAGPLPLSPSRPPSPDPASTSADATSSATTANGRTRGTAAQAPPPLETRPSILNQLSEPPTAGAAEKAFAERQANSVVIRIEVSDSGPGIRPSDAARLFEPFVQTNLGIAQAGKGSGLGLAIVRQIVSLTGGRLGFRSRKNGGSTFWVEFRWCLATSEEIQAHRNESSAFASHDPADSLLDTPISTPPAVDHRNIFFDSSGGPDPQQVQQSISMLRRTDTSNRIGMARPPPEPDIVSIEPPNPHAPPFHKAHSAPDPTLDPARDIVSPLLLSSASEPPPPSQPQQEGTETEGEREREKERPLRVLVVDDDMMTRTLMARMLTRLGAEVTTACDGQQALDLLLGTSSSQSQSQAQAGTSSRAVSPTSPELPDDPAAGPVPAPESQNEPQYFDLISLDNAMPVMTGQQAVRKLRSLGRTDFVVGATGNALKSDQKAYLEAGADQVLSKPVMLKDIKAVMQIALERRNAAPRKPQQVAPSATKTTRPFIHAPYFPLLPHDLEA
ncbi:hypothetical protein BOTBODRAFT_149123 [Botryobasidium botryosum FD-172 SS1]|uniref:histidine kinase n=1 Tax=Botryobasidium botryosum (strain FD-172 SS1) TaxID=930990 RepID=A0A067M7M3_BOTB1|nr:hypothetical protein BOTBODRAFT_149123 [Botryobasidium botryosum FD-172 SS1]